MSWYYNDVSGQIFEYSGTGKWFEDREIQIEQHAASLGVGSQINFGPFATQQEAQDYKNAHPSHGPISAANSAAHAANQAVQGNLKYVLSGSGFTTWFVRGLKVAVGLLLMVAGIMKLAGGEQKLATVASGVPGIGGHLAKAALA